MPAEEHSPATPYCLPLPLLLLPSSSFLLLRLTGVQLLLSQDRMEQGFDSLDSPCAYKANITKAQTVSSKNKEELNHKKKTKGLV